MGIGGHQHSRGSRVYGDSRGILHPALAAAFAPHYHRFESCGAREQKLGWGSGALMIGGRRQSWGLPDAQRAGGG